MLAMHTSEWFTGLVMVGALAAFMSTLGSQLLALSTIVTRDFVLPFRKKIDLKQQVMIGRIWVVIFAFVGLAIAAQPFDTIDDMGRLAFAGLAVLFPVTLAVLRWGGVHPFFAIVSIIIGEFLLVAFYYGLISSDWLFGLDRSIGVLIVCFLIVIFGTLIKQKARKQLN